MGRVKTNWICFLSCLIASLVLFLPLTYGSQFKVTRVYDGDTIKAEDHDVEIKVRLLGIDAPETSKKKRDPGQPYSQQATKFLAGFILNKVVDIKEYGLDIYGRILGIITFEGRNINLEMIKEGYAEVYRGKHPHGFNTALYMKKEEEAKKAKKGMWVQGDKYLSPRAWRSAQKGNKYIDKNQ